MFRTHPTLAPSWHSSYHPGGYGVSEGLRRARRPFLVRNILTGTALMAFVTGTYFYSISKVRQDDFGDLGAPTDEQVKGLKSIEDEKREEVEKKAALNSPPKSS